MLPPVCEDGVRLTELIVHQVHDIVDVLFPAVLHPGTFTYSRLAAIYRFLRSGKFSIFRPSMRKQLTWR